MQTLILVLHILAAAGIVVLVLLQHGKGADMGAAFGSGSAGSLFGSAGAANFLSRTTAILAAVFFATSLGLTYFSVPSRSGGVTQQLEVPAVPASKATTPGETKPAAPAPSAPAPAGNPAESSKSSEIPK
jgi:preprotein translocase subunit SecG